MKENVPKLVQNAIGNEIVQIILYGSCARGDFHEDSDIDIALIVRKDREDINQYQDVLAGIATQIAMKNYAIVNFICLAQEDYLQKKAWYPYYKNIDMEGEVFYGKS